MLHLTGIGYNSDAMDMLQVQVGAGRLPENPGEILLSSRSLSHFAQAPQIGDRIKQGVGIRKEASTGQEKKINGLGDYGWDLDESFQAQMEHEYTVVGFMKEVGRGNWSSTFILPAITCNDYRTVDGAKKAFVYTKMKSMDHIKEKTESILSSMSVSNVSEDSAKQLHQQSDCIRGSVLWLVCRSAFAGAMITTLAATIQPMRKLNKAKIVEALVREN